MGFILLEQYVLRTVQNREFYGVMVEWGIELEFASKNRNYLLVAKVRRRMENGEWRNGGSRMED